MRKVTIDLQRERQRQDARSDGSSPHALDVALRRDGRARARSGLRPRRRTTNYGRRSRPIVASERLGDRRRLPPQARRPSSLDAADVVVWLDLPMRVWLPAVLLRRTARRIRERERALERQPRDARQRALGPRVAPGRSRCNPTSAGGSEYPERARRQAGRSPDHSEPRSSGSWPASRRCSHALGRVDADQVEAAGDHALRRRGRGRAGTTAPGRRARGTRGRSGGSRRRAGSRTPAAAAARAARLPRAPSPGSRSGA